MEHLSRPVSVHLSDGTVIQVEVTSTGDQEVGTNLLSFADSTQTIQSLVTDIATTLHDIQQEVRPKTFTVKLGLELSVESGKLTTMLVKGGSKANLEISMGWSE